ncbi:MAG: replication and repair protein RecF [Thermoleophilaceae bacterium]|jgi:DNA replication and repair protein RecF|nr:replication and repair protein RecF [Thermoleophilaceae bacterium]
MVVTRLAVRDFRNYERAEVDLGPGLNVVAGANGAGKTNLLEALYVGLTARSCRTSNERELVRIGAQVARVELGVDAPDGAHVLEVGIAPGDEKRVRVDGAPPARGVDPPRPLAAVFLPDRLELVKGPPALRRAHLDQVVAALWPARVATRSAYTRALAQRNALIARVRAGAASADQLDTWDAELARHGIALMADRAATIELVAPSFAARAEELGLPEKAGLRYTPRSRAGDADGLRAELAERRGSDLDRGFTTHGPHRDDLALVHGGRALRTLGSQGQQRLGLLALLFGERDALAARGTPPLMLLDDVMSELDAARRERLSDLVRADGQALITTTDADHVPGSDAGEVALFQVAAGTAVRAGEAIGPAA